MDSKHERLADRFADIFIRLHSNEKLQTKQLATDYRVSSKTISRDLSRLECYLPLIRHKGLVYLDISRQFNLTHKEFGELVKLLGVHQLLPNMDISFLRDLIQNKHNNPYHIGYYRTETIESSKHVFNFLENAIHKQLAISCNYHSKSRIIHPYKLVHKDGYWYLIGTENQQLKSYHLSKLIDLEITKEVFMLDDGIHQLIEAANSVWIGEQEITALVCIKKDVAPYFLKCQVLPKQLIKNYDKQILIVQSTVWHYNELASIVRAWIPHLTIIEPKEWQDRLEGELRSYLD